MDFFRKTAILVDGGFYRRRAQLLWGEKSAQERADELHDYCLRHISNKHEKRDLYRILYYDCAPSEKKVYHPYLNKQINFKESELYHWSNHFLKALASKRKVAIRLGELADSQASYLLTPKVTKRILNGSLKLDEITENDFFLDMKQKGVDIRIGIDISSIAFKRQVDQIILISGDCDFVPAAKQARREGIDFILDPMWATIRASLNEHVDGISSKCEKPKEKMSVLK